MRHKLELHPSNHHNTGTVACVKVDVDMESLDITHPVLGHDSTGGQSCEQRGATLTVYKEM